MTKAVRSFCVYGAACLISIATSAASVITWDSPHTISGDSDVATDGTLVYAYNLGPAIFVSGETINGVNFSPFVITGVNPASNGNISIDVPSGSPLGLSGLGSLIAPFSGLSSSYQGLLSTAGVSFALEDTSMTLTLGNLTSGQQYEFQFWVNFSTSGGTTAQGHDTQAEAGNTVALSANTTGAAGGVGEYVTGTFTADSSTQDIHFSATSAGGTPTIAALQVRASTAPEPSTVALLLCGAAMVGWKIRRLTSRAR